MHFWIDKRSNQCTYSGRHRVPSSLSAGVGRSRGRVGVGVGRKGMVTPVHCFLGPSTRGRSSNRYNNNGPQPMPAVHARSTRRAGERSSGGGRGASDAYAQPPTLQMLAAQRSVTPDTLLRTAALGPQRPPQLMPPHLRCGMWASFALATIFVAGAKFYFDHQARVIRGGVVGGGGGEAGVVCAVVGALVVSGCALSMCRSRPAPLALPDRVSSTAHRPPLSPTREPSDDLSLGTLLQTVSSERSEVGGAGEGAASPPDVTAGEAPPPPYHIAVLLPHSAAAPSTSEPPPPAYSAIS